MSNTNKIATLGGGCFWCTEAIFQRLKGVTSTISGYVDDIESLQITFDPQIISYANLVEVFFATHDPTSLDKQMYDVGKAYRSAIFCVNDEQKTIAEKLKTEIPNAVTEINPLTKFSKAEDYHQNYYNQNQDKTYCQIIINPKLQKLQEKFSRLMI